MLTQDAGKESQVPYLPPRVTMFVPQMSGSCVTCPGKSKTQTPMGVKGSGVSTGVYEFGKKLQLKHER